MTLNPVLTSVIEESKKPAGTWSYSFLSNIFKTVKKKRVQEYSKFFIATFDYMKTEEATPLQRFKLAQLLSSLNQQNYGKAENFLQTNKQEIMKFAETCNNTPLEHATKKLLVGLFITHVQSKSVRFVSASAEPSLHPTEASMTKSLSIVFDT